MKPFKKLAAEDIRREDITTPQNFWTCDEKLQAYLVDIELFTLIRQLLELNMTRDQAIDLLTVSLMKHDTDNAMLFNEQLFELHERFLHGNAWRRGLVRYFWVGGIGINTIMKLTRSSQSSVYLIAYETERDLEMGRLRSMSRPFINSQFYYNLDMTIRALSTFDGKEVRQPTKPTTKFDILRSTLKRVRIWGDRE